jgi:hypothetical protein
MKPKDTVIMPRINKVISGDIITGSNPAGYVTKLISLAPAADGG